MDAHPTGEREGRTRGRTGRRLRFAGAVAALALPIGAVVAGSGVAGAATVRSATTATTQSVALSFDYQCYFPIIGAVDLPTTITGTAPATVSPGESFSLTGVQASTTLPAGLVDILVFVESSVSGTVTTFDFDSAAASGGVVNGAASPIPFGPVPLHWNTPAVITAPASGESIGTFTAPASGSVTITPGKLADSAWFGQISCSVAGRGPAPSIVIPVTTTALPVGAAVGGLAVASLAGAGFVTRQRRRTPRGGPVTVGTGR